MPIETAYFDDSGKQWIVKADEGKIAIYRKACPVVLFDKETARALAQEILKKAQQ